MDLEHLYVHWMATLGEALQAAEDVERPKEQKPTVFVYKSKDSKAFKNWRTQNREPLFEPSAQTGTKAGNTNIAYTYVDKSGDRPARLIDVATQQLLYSTMVLGRRKSSPPADAASHFAHWAELGLGYWFERQADGPPGYVDWQPFQMEPEVCRKALKTPKKGPLRQVAKEVTNLIGLETLFFYGTSDDVPLHQAKARAFVAFLLEANPETKKGRKVKGHGRDGFLAYLREAYGTARAHSSDALDEVWATSRWRRSPTLGRSG